MLCSDVVTPPTAGGNGPTRRIFFIFEAFAGIIWSDYKILKKCLFYQFYEIWKQGSSLFLHADNGLNKTCLAERLFPFCGRSGAGERIPDFRLSGPVAAVEVLHHLPAGFRNEEQKQVGKVGARRKIVLKDTGAQGRGGPGADPVGPVHRRLDHRDIQYPGHDIRGPVRDELTEALWAKPGQEGSSG